MPEDRETYLHYREKYPGVSKALPQIIEVLLSLHYRSRNMNKNRIKKLEEKAEGVVDTSRGLPKVWRPEGGKVAISESPFILERLRSLGREIAYSPYIFRAVLVEATDSEIIDRTEGRNLYLKGIKKPISGIVEIQFTANG